MRFLEADRRALDVALPGLDDALADVPLQELEGRGGPGPALFKQAGGPAMLVPAEHKGLGLGAVEAVRVQRALATRSPSLAVATTMHHFSVAGLREAYAAGHGMEWLLLEAVATENLLMASAFAEGRTGQSILTSSIRCRRDGTELVLDGSKKPCSLASSMDVLTASVGIDDPDSPAGPRLAVAVVPASAPGVSVRPFWDSFVLAGAESDEVVLDGVRVADTQVVELGIAADGTLDRVQTVGFIWFELLMAASYLGMASILVERVLEAGRAHPSVTASLLVETEAAMSAVLGAAAVVDAATDEDEPELSRALVSRFAAQRAIDRLVPQAVEALGGMSYVGSSDTAYVAACAAALKFHPPGAAASAAALTNAYTGGPLVLG